MIRPATLKDVPRLLEMGRKFADKADLQSHVGYDAHSMAQTFEAMIEGENFCLFIGDNGAIGGIMAPHPFNYEQMIADELFWWSEGREGLQLLAAYEEWASDAVTRMTALEAVEPERMKRFYERRGYVPLERAYVKVNRRLS